MAVPPGYPIRLGPRSPSPTHSATSADPPPKLIWIVIIATILVLTVFAALFVLYLRRSRVKTQESVEKGEKRPPRRPILSKRAIPEPTRPPPILLPRDIIRQLCAAPTPGPQMYRYSSPSQSPISPKSPYSPSGFVPPCWAEANDDPLPESFSWDFRCKGDADDGPEPVAEVPPKQPPADNSEIKCPKPKVVRVSLKPVPKLIKPTIVLDSIREEDETTSPISPNSLPVESSKAVYRPNIPRIPNRSPPRNQQRRRTAPPASNSPRVQPKSRGPVVPPTKPSWNENKPPKLAPRKPKRPSSTPVPITKVAQTTNPSRLKISTPLSTITNTSPAKSPLGIRSPIPPSSGTITVKVRVNGEPEQEIFAFKVGAGVLFDELVAKIEKYVDFKFNLFAADPSGGPTTAVCTESHLRKWIDGRIAGNVGNKLDLWRRT